MVSFFFRCLLHQRYKATRISSWIDIIICYFPLKVNRSEKTRGEICELSFLILRFQLRFSTVPILFRSYLRRMFRKPGNRIQVKCYPCPWHRYLRYRFCISFLFSFITPASFVFFVVIERFTAIRAVHEIKFSCAA